MRKFLFGIIIFVSMSFIIVLNGKPKHYTLTNLLKENDSIDCWANVGIKIYDLETKQLVEQEYNDDSTYAHIFVPIAKDTAYKFFVPHSFSEYPSIFEVTEDSIYLGREKVDVRPICISGDTARISDDQDVFATGEIHLIQQDFVKMKVSSKILLYLMRKEFVSKPKKNFKFDPGIMPEGSRNHHCVNHD